ncbi:MAG: hypothetical protein OHK0029_11400 [Armatimonadaceae bacterium]
MANKNDFSVDDWDVIRNAPNLVAATMMVAGKSGMLGTFGEAFAVARSMYDSLSSDTPLIRDIANPEETKEAQEHINHLLTGFDSDRRADELKAATLAKLDQALVLISEKDSSDLAAYKQWVYSIAERVARASKEGAFLGFGGEVVSAQEEALLQELRTKLNVG